MRRRSEKVRIFLVIAVLLMAAGTLVACETSEQENLSGSAVEPIQPPPGGDPGGAVDPPPGGAVQPPGGGAVDPGGAVDDPGGTGGDPGKDIGDPEKPPAIPGFEDAWAQLQPLLMQIDQQKANQIGQILQPFRGEVLDYLGARGIIENECPDCLPTYMAIYEGTKLLTQDPDLTPALIRDARARGTAEAFAADQPVAVPDLIDWIEDFTDLIEDLEP
jgi:hypothetical protein